MIPRALKYSLYTLIVIGFLRKLMRKVVSRKPKIPKFKEGSPRLLMATAFDGTHVALAIFDENIEKKVNLNRISSSVRRVLDKCEIYWVSMDCLYDAFGPDGFETFETRDNPYKNLCFKEPDRLALVHAIEAVVGYGNFRLV